MGSDFSEAAAGAKPGKRRTRRGAASGGISYEHRVILWLACFTFPSILFAGLLTFTLIHSFGWAAAASLSALLVLSFASGSFFTGLIRPLQTLTNVVAALREDDFSCRARGARLGDALGDLALEINALANTLQTQRVVARDALSLLERVMSSMQAPVLVFDSNDALRLINAAGERAFHLAQETGLGRSADQLGLRSLTGVSDENLYTAPYEVSARWSVRRTSFPLQGVPHTLFVLTDVSAALREEERFAWQRLIRVLSHELNNSLTPIKSLAGSLRSRVSQLPETGTAAAELHRGLHVIEERAASLNRFLQAYQQLTRLPQPKLKVRAVRPLLTQLVHLETRLPVLLQPGAEAFVLGDADQLQQLLINLVRNAADSALSSAQGEPAVVIEWICKQSEVLIQVHDNGSGMANPANLFVPFYTTKPEGSGIGLVLAQQIASAHKGSVSLINHVDAPGCTAELRLPLLEHDPEQEPVG